MTKAFAYLTLNYTECQLKNIEEKQMSSYYSPRYGLQMVTCLEGKKDTFKREPYISNQAFVLLHTAKLEYKKHGYSEYTTITNTYSCSGKVFI